MACTAGPGRLCGAVTPFRALHPVDAQHIYLCGRIKETSTPLSPGYVNLCLSRFIGLVEVLRSCWQGTSKEWMRIGKHWGVCLRVEWIGGLKAHVLATRQQEASRDSDREDACIMLNPKAPANTTLGERAQGTLVVGCSECATRACEAG